MTEGPDEMPETEEFDPYLDTVDRLERAVDHQISIINGIDDKAEHVTRLLGILIGLIFSVLSLVVKWEVNGLQSPSKPVEVLFTMGVFSLLFAMAAAIVTYLSSKFRIGLHYNVGYYLSEPDVDVDTRKHTRRILGAYGSMIEQNKRVIETNSHRFRWTLYLLLVGVLFLSTAGILYLGRISTPDAWIGFGASVIIALVAGWYILTGRYLTLPSVNSNHE